MARYLIVAHLTAGSPELRRHVATVRKTDPTAEFTLLLPATPASYWRAWDELEAQATAERRADAASLMLEGIGANVVRRRIGAREPLAAIDDELREHPGYDEVIISTLPANVSRWLKLDLVAQCRRRHPELAIHHVVAQPTTMLVPDLDQPATPTAVGNTSGNEPAIETAAGHGATTTGPSHLIGEDDLGALPLPDVRRGDLPEELKEFWDRLDGGDGVANIFRMLGNNPHLLHAYVQMVNAIWQHSGIEPALRELAILRVAQMRRGRYLWHEHVRVARSIGMPDSQITALEHWRSAEHVRFTERERALLGYVEAICQNKGTQLEYTLLLKEFPLSAIVGLQLLIGFYVMTDSFAQAMKVEPEEAFIGWNLY